MLTGELPIGRFAARSKKAEIDVRLDEVGLRTLEKEPQRRYQHASHVKSDMRSIASSNDSSLARTVIYEAAFLSYQGSAPVTCCSKRLPPGCCSRVVS